MAVTPAQVQRIIEYDTVLIPDVQPFIDDAVVFLTAIIGDAITPTQFDLVTRYTAAHFIGITDPRLQSEQVKTLQASYQYRLSDGLGLTHWGAQAMLLDPSGKLAVWNNKVKKGLAGPDFFWAGESNE